MRIAQAAVICSLALHPVTSPAGSTQAYEMLKSLAGDWEAELSGFGKLSSTIRLVSNGKAVEEVIGTPDDNELSIYTLNGDKILLTHYCAMTSDGHQVRLQTSAVGSTATPLDFRFVSATNLRSHTAPHMQRVVMTIQDQDHYSARWTKVESGKETVFDLNFVRKK